MFLFTLEVIPKNDNQEVFLRLPGKIAEGFFLVCDNTNFIV